jgi:hypothetical protein
MDLDALLTRCRLADGRIVDIGIAGGRIATLGEDTAPSLSNRVPILDIGGDLVAIWYCPVSSMVTCISTKP